MRLPIVSSKRSVKEMPMSGYGNGPSELFPSREYTTSSPALVSVSVTSFAASNRHPVIFQAGCTG